MTYQEIKLYLEEMERKVHDQNLDEATLLTIDDGIDTKQVLIKRKSLYGENRAPERASEADRTGKRSNSAMECMPELMRAKHNEAYYDEEEEDAWER